MKTFEVFKREANKTEKISLGLFKAKNKKEVCSKLASIYNGYFISAKEII